MLPPPHPTRQLASQTPNIIAMMVLLCLAATSHAQVIPAGGNNVPVPPPPAGGNANITNVALNGNGTVTISGTYSANQFWAPQYIHVYFSENLAAGNKVVFLDVGAIAGGVWTVTTPPVAAGAYIAWVVYGIKNGPDLQELTAPLQNINAPGLGAVLPAPSSTVTWGAVARNAGNQLAGNGNWAKPANWNFGGSWMFCLPVSGGVIDAPAINFAGNGTWTSTSNYAFAANTFYNVVPFAFASNGPLEEFTSGNVKVNK